MYLSDVVNAVDSSIPHFKSHKSIDKEQFWVTKTEGNTSNIRGKQQNNRNSEVRQNQTPTYMEKKYLITTAIFLVLGTGHLRKQCFVFNFLNIINSV